MRTEGALKTRIRRWTWRLLGGFLIAFVVVTVMTLISYPNATDNFRSFPLAFVVVVLMFLAVANIPRCLNAQRYGQGFISSASVIAALVFLLGMSLYPNLVVSSPDPENSLTIHNAASSVTTLKTMALFAGIGLPFVISYSAVVYWTFWGKVELNSHSY
jgi:cytochrome d ubiquinol oxidase subunit II